MPIETTDGAIVATGQAGIAMFHLLALKHAVRLEELGLKRRGRSATVIAKEQFGLPKRASRLVVLNAIQAAITELESALAAENAEAAQRKEVVAG